MKKTVLIIGTTIVGLCLLAILIVVGWLYVHNISPIFIERELKEHLGISTFSFEHKIFEESNNRYFELGEPHQRSPNILVPEGPVFHLAFDRQWDMMITKADRPEGHLSYNQPSISGNWYVYHIPNEYAYQVGVSVCGDGFIRCQTRYYDNPQCFQLVYVPGFYDRHPKELHDGCEVVDMRTITVWDRIFVSLELKQGKNE